jgi:transposase
MLSFLLWLNLSPPSSVFQAHCFERKKGDTLQETGTARREVILGSPQKVPLRQLMQQEREELTRKAQSKSERVDGVKKARALLAVADGCTFTTASQQAGMSREGVSQLVERFDKLGLDVLLVAPGRGRKPTYTSQDHERILQEVQRCPHWETDQSTVWSLSLLQRSLRTKGFPHIGSTTIRQVLQMHGWSYQPTRIWHQTN